MRDAGIGIDQLRSCERNGGGVQAGEKAGSAAEQDVHEVQPQLVE
jgi:hypothetical protein